YEQMDFYNSYLIGNQVFDRTNSDTALGNQTPHGYPLPVARLREFYGWYHAKLTATCTQPLVS
ncbi:MAG: hypothetical protein KDE19_21520, partial [Caldilineaceae bacterium]|nr:hypothetical protein [Caldilineaceae bacterium]